jgi:hypothetical protein
MGLLPSTKIKEKNMNIKMLVTVLETSLLCMNLSSAAWAKDDIQFTLVTQNNAGVNNYALEYKDSHFTDKSLDAKRKRLIEIFLTPASSIKSVGHLITRKMAESFAFNHTFKEIFMKENLNINDFKKEFLKFYEDNVDVVPFNLLYHSKVKLSAVNKDYCARTVDTSIQNIKDFERFLGQKGLPTTQEEFAHLIFNRILFHLEANKQLINLKKEDLVSDQHGTNGLIRIFLYVLYEVDAFTRLYLENALQDHVEVALAYEKTPMGSIELKAANLAEQVQGNDAIALTESDAKASDHLIQTYHRDLVKSLHENETNDSRLFINPKVFPKSFPMVFSPEDRAQTLKNYSQLKKYSKYLPDADKKFVVPEKELAFARLQHVKGHSIFLASLHAGTSGADSIGSIAMIAERYRAATQNDPSPLIIAGDFNTNNDDNELNDKLRIRDLKSGVESISQLLKLRCKVHLPEQNTVDKERAWTTQLDKVNKADKASRDGFVSCIKMEFVGRMKLKVAPLSVGHMGVSQENASDHAKVETKVSLTLY